MHAHLSEEAREYAKMFKDIERHSQLRSYYIGCNKVSNLLVAIWLAQSVEHVSHTLRVVSSSPISYVLFSRQC